MSHLIKSDRLASPSFALSHRAFSRRAGEEMQSEAETERTNTKDEMYPRCLTHSRFTWRSSIYPPSITLTRNRWAVGGKLYYVGAEVIYRSLNGNLLSGRSQRVTNVTPPPPARYPRGVCGKVWKTWKRTFTREVIKSQLQMQLHRWVTFIADCNERCVSV